jgi:hypothetical protein
MPTSYADAIRPADAAAHERNIPARRSGDVRTRSVTGVTVVGVRGHLVAVEAHLG